MNLRGTFAGGAGTLVFGFSPLATEPAAPDVVVTNLSMGERIPDMKVAPDGTLMRPRAKQ